MWGNFIRTRSHDDVHAGPLEWHRVRERERLLSIGCGRSPSIRRALSGAQRRRELFQALFSRSLFSQILGPPVSSRVIRGLGHAVGSRGKRISTTDYRARGGACLRSTISPPIRGQSRRTTIAATRRRARLCASSLGDTTTERKTE